MKKPRQKFIKRPAVQKLLGEIFAGYMRFVYWSCRLSGGIIIDPADRERIIRDEWPGIYSMWHGQHFMTPFGRPHWAKVAVMIALHGDAEINAIAAKILGMEVVRASGSNDSRSESVRKRGAAGLIAMVRLLQSGSSVALTADVPKGPDKIAGRGIVILAKHSGRAIRPLAVVNQFRINVNSWDHAAIPLPFGRMAVVIGDPVHVPADATDDELDRLRREVKRHLDRAHERAYEFVDRRPGTFVTRAPETTAEV